MTYAVLPLDESTRDAFAGALVEANNGVFGGCWCMGFHGDDSKGVASPLGRAEDRRAGAGLRRAR